MSAATAIATTNGNGPAMLPEAVERVLIGGDLSQLNGRERLAYYQSRCEAAGLDPRTQPFEYITLKGKLTLYAKKSATDQLIAVHKLTVKIVGRGFERDLPGCYSVHCQVAFPHGQCVEDAGVVWVPDKLAGEDLANLLMKCITKAKRRTVLSACGLGMLDETEVDSIPEARREPERPALPGPRPAPQPSGPAATMPTGEPSSEHVSELRRFAEGELNRVNDYWQGVLLMERKDDALAKFKTLAVPKQIANHLVKLWVSIGALSEDDIRTDGKRDPNKVALAIGAAWDQDKAEVMAQVRSYLRGKLVEAAKEASVELAQEEPVPAEEIDQSDSDEASDGWEDGRE